MKKLYRFYTLCLLLLLCVSLFCVQAFAVEDMEGAHALHDEMGCIVRENKAMGIYFITDPDGCWLEIVPL